MSSPPAGRGATPVATGTGVGPAAVVPRNVTGSAIVVARGSVSRRSVLLTFDAGADTGFAAQILDTLKAAGVTATFGITGRWAEGNTALVRRIVAEGHSIVNHTYDHSSFTGTSTHTAGLPADRRIAEITQADQVLSAMAGRAIKPWFRLPYGDSDRDVGGQVLEAGYRFVLGWTVDSLGWQGLSADAISARCLGRAAPGVIYLFHVGSRSQDAVALPAIIQSLKAQGYGFDTVADLVS
jgi:peptidoglycan/xylan/chitin deacetylase (PgdA/CDA1 family)